MARPTWIHRAAGLALAGTLVLGGCGDDDESADTGDTAADDQSGAPGIGDVNDEGTRDLSGDGDAPELEMELDDNSFEPTFVQAAPGATVTLHLANDGERRHTFTVDGGPDQELDGGDAAEVEVTVPDSGVLEFRCEIHADSGMRGAFFVGDSSAVPGSETTATTEADDGDSSGGVPGY
jgi:plastocyanin